MRFVVGETIKDKFIGFMWLVNINGTMITALKIDVKTLQI